LTGHYQRGVPDRHRHCDARARARDGPGRRRRRDGGAGVAPARARLSERAGVALLGAVAGRRRQRAAGAIGQRRPADRPPGRPAGCGL